jgi:hypothetical protein
MKKVFLTAVFALILTYTSTAQDSNGYVGVSVGAVIPFGDLADEINTGLELGFINAGYRFNETWGVTANWGQFIFKDDKKLTTPLGTIDKAISRKINYFAIGPMITFGNFDFKPQYAFSNGKDKVKTTTDIEDFEIINIDSGIDIDQLWILGTTYNLDLGGKFGLAGNLDYVFIKKDGSSKYHNLLKVSVGFNYRF